MKQLTSSESKFLDTIAIILSFDAFLRAKDIAALANTSRAGRTEFKKSLDRERLYQLIDPEIISLDDNNETYFNAYNRHALITNEIKKIPIPQKNCMGILHDRLISNPIYHMTAIVDDKDARRIFTDLVQLNYFLTNKRFSSSIGKIKYFLFNNRSIRNQLFSTPEGLRSLLSFFPDISEEKILNFFSDKRYCTRFVKGDLSNLYYCKRKLPEFFKQIFELFMDDCKYADLIPDLSSLFKFDKFFSSYRMDIPNKIKEIISIKLDIWSFNFLNLLEFNKRFPEFVNQAIDSFIRRYPIYLLCVEMLYKAFFLNEKPINMIETGQKFFILTGNFFASVRDTFGLDLTLEKFLSLEDLEALLKTSRSDYRKFKDLLYKRKLQNYIGPDINLLRNENESYQDCYLRHEKELKIIRSELLAASFFETSLERLSQKFKICPHYYPKAFLTKESLKKIIFYAHDAKTYYSKSKEIEYFNYFLEELNLFPQYKEQVINFIFNDWRVLSFIIEFYSLDDLDRL